MTTHLPDSLSNRGSVSQPAVYRPRYRQRVGNPEYSLVAPPAVQKAAPPSLFDAVEALEEWAADNPLSATKKATRWHPDKAMGLKIYISPTLGPDWSPLLRKAMTDWQYAGAGNITFTTTIRPDEADICISAVEQATLGRDFEVGHTNRDVNNAGWITRVTIELLTAPLIDRHLSPDKQTKRKLATALHEMGHALGLEHSESKHDVMHHQGWQHSVLSKQDIKRLNDLYEAPVNTRFWI